MDDVTPQLLEAVKGKFNKLIESDEKISKLYAKLEAKQATYAEANQFAVEVGNALAKSFKSEVSSDGLPDGRMYYNIAQQLVGETLKNNHEMVADYSTQVQADLNEKAGISLKALEPDYDTDRADGIIDYVSNAEEYDKIASEFEETLINFTHNVVTQSVKKNVEFQYRSGLKPKVVRTSAGDCCEWCSDVAGTYTYPDVPKNMFKRHNYCRCTVEYDGVKLQAHYSEKSGSWNTFKDEEVNRNDINSKWEKIKIDTIGNTPQKKNGDDLLKMNLQFFASSKNVKRKKVPNSDPLWDSLVSGDIEKQKEEGTFWWKFGEYKYYVEYHEDYGYTVLGKKKLKNIHE